MDFASNREPFADASSADSSIERYSDGTPVRRNKHGKRLASRPAQVRGSHPLIMIPITIPNRLTSSLCSA